jgi:uncharacterized protein (TIGR01370 family)
MRWILLIIVFALILSIILYSGNYSRKRNLFKTKSWFCYYGADNSIFNSNVELLVLESNNIGPITEEIKNNKICLAYLSVGELNLNSTDTHDLNIKKLKVNENKNWTDSIRVDVRSSEWQDKVLQLARQRIQNGYDGFFIDTIDSAEFLEEKEIKYRGMINSAVKIIKMLRDEFPDAYIIVNGGVKMAEKLTPFIDAFCIESVIATYNFNTQEYYLREGDELDWSLNRVSKLKKYHLPIFSIDYCNKQTKIKTQRLKLFNLGIKPAFSSISLNELPQ